MAKKIEVQMTMVDKLSKTTDKVRGKIQQLTRSFSDFTKKLVNLKSLAIAAIFVTVGRAVIGAAAKIEVFGKQLEIVSGSAGEANDQLAKMREFARTSPLETEDVVQSYVRLRAVGINPTMQDMKTLGGVAVMMNRKMLDVLSAFIGLHTKTLRRLGIMINRTGKMAVIESGNMRITVENDAKAIRTALLEMWEKRFPNAIERAAQTTVSKTAIMKSEVFELAAAVGEKLLPAWNAVVVAIGEAASIHREFISPREITNIETVSARLKELQADLRGGFVRKEGGALGSLTLVNREEIEKDIEILETAMRKLEALRFEAEAGVVIRGEGKFQPAISRIKGMEKERDALIAAEEAKGEAAAKAAEAEAKRFKKLDELRIRENVKTAKWLDDQVLMTTEEELTRFHLLQDMANKRTEITSEEWEERNRIQAEAMNIGKTQRQIAFDEEIALLEHKKELFPQLEEEIQALINRKKKKAANIRKAFDKRDSWDQINNYMHLGSAINQIASQAIANAKMSAKKRQNILVALAMAEGAASAVTMAKAGFDQGITIYDKIALAAAGIITALGMTGVQIASIKAQKFARGTSYAPGGFGIVGEEGPEAMFIPRGSQIMTNAQTRNTFGGTNISLSVVVEGDASDRTVEKIGNTLEQFGRDFTNAHRRGHIDFERLGLVTV
jgi:hypothetical protein